MEPNFKTSFIPKKPISINQGSSPSPVRSFNIYSLLATTFFILALLASGGLFAYTKILEGDIATAGQEIEDARSAFQVDEIKDLIAASARIKAINSLLEKHVVVSKILTLLEELTLKKVRYTEFHYAIKNNAPTIDMKVESQTYNALAVQGNIFDNNEFIQNPTFTSYAAGENGLITTTFFATINPSFISYKNSVEPEVLNQ